MLQGNQKKTDRNGAQGDMCMYVGGHGTGEGSEQLSVKEQLSALRGFSVQNSLQPTEATM